MTADEQAIRDLQHSWLAATAEGDVARLLQLMADDVVFLVAGRPPFGRDEFVAAIEAGRNLVRLAAEGEFEEVVVAGDVAYARGRLAVDVIPLAGGERKRMAGYTLSVFRRRADGSWVLARDANLLTLSEPPTGGEKVGVP